MKFIEWVKYSEFNPPPMGCKILWFARGDCYVVQYVELDGDKYFLPIPFTDSRFGWHVGPPEYWTSIPLPEDYKGCMKIETVGGKKMTLDECRTHNPAAFKEFISMFLEGVKKDWKKRQKNWRTNNEPVLRAD